MNIFEFLSFDIGEFVTSLPGILIISGIVLLILALIILSTGKKKEAVVENVVTPAPVVPEAVVNSNSGQTTFDNNVEKSLTDMSRVANIPTPVVEQPVVVAPTVPVMESPVTPSTPVVEQPVVVPTVEAVVNVPVQPEISINPDFSLPKVESLQVENPVVSENLVTNVAPVMPTPVVVEAPRPIYGGANPLENTAQVPVEAARQAYSGAFSAQPIPMVQPVVNETPIVHSPVTTEPVYSEPKPVEMSIPTVSVPSAPVAPSNPTVMAQPVVNNSQPEIETLEF